MHRSFPYPPCKKIAVVGAGGFIGTNACLTFARRGLRVRALSRRFATPLDDVPGIEPFVGLAGDRALVERLVEDCDCVLYLGLGATPRSSLVQMTETAIAGIGDALHLMRACAEVGARLIFLSSGGAVYGITDQVPTPENAMCRPISAYGATSLAVETYLRVAAHLFGLDYRVLRVANPFGPHQAAGKGQGVVAAFLHAALIENRPIEIWGDGHIVRDYLTIDDLIEAIVLTMVHDGSERIFNIGSGKGLSLLAVIEAIETMTGRPLSRIIRPANRADVPVSQLDIARARDDLGWRPKIPFAEGLAAARDWMVADKTATSTRPAVPARTGADSR